MTSGGTGLLLNWLRQAISSSYLFASTIASTFFARIDFGLIVSPNVPLKGIGTVTPYLPRFLVLAD